MGNYKVPFFLFIIFFCDSVFAIMDLNSSNNQLTKIVTVTDTQSLNLKFIYIDGEPVRSSTFQSSIDFLESIFPISDNALTDFDDSQISSHPDIRIDYRPFLTHFLKAITKSSIIAGQYDRTIGVVREGWFQFTSEPTANGYSMLKTNETNNNVDYTAVLIEDSELIHILSHELAHSIAGLCDERDSDVWFSQDNSNYPNSCPNALNKSSPARQLNISCMPDGCPVEVPGIIAKQVYREITDINSDKHYANFLGGISQKKWIDQESYEQLFKAFSKNRILPSASSTMMISANLERESNNVSLDPAYELGQHTVSLSCNNCSGNYSLITFDASNNILFMTNFSPSFLVGAYNGDESIVNSSYFVYVVNNSIPIAKVEVRYNGQIKASMTRSTYKPHVAITYPTLGQNLTNTSFNLTWSVIDTDSTNLSYAILLSRDNGTSYSTWLVDFPNTSITINGSEFDYSNIYKIKILVTDGVNTGANTSANFIMGTKKPVMTYKNAASQNIAQFNSYGDLLLKGTYSHNPTKARTANDEWIIQENNQDILILDMVTGNLYIDGYKHENQASLVPNNQTSFIVKDKLGAVIAYLNKTGDLFLKGAIYQNATIGG
jgi:hypothetical protein